LVVELQNHIICTSQPNPRPSKYVVYTFHNQNIEYTDQRVGCDHCAQLTSAYLDNYLAIVIKFNLSVVLIGFGGIVVHDGFFLCCSLVLEPLNIVLILRRY